MAHAPSADPTPTRSRASGVVGALGAFIGCVALALVVLGVVGLANVATPHMQGFNAGATVTMTDRGMSVYARSDADRSTTVCVVQDGGSTTLARPTSQFAVEVSGSDFYEVARTPQDLAAGRYVLSCEGTSQALYVGPAAPNTVTPILMGPASLVGGILLGICAVILLVTAIVLRAVGRKTSTAPSGSPSYGYPSPPPPPVWTSPEPPTQNIPYGQGHYGSRPSSEGATGRPAGDDEPDSRSPYAPPPPPPG